MSLAGLDIAILAVVLLSALIGLVRGLVKEVLSLISWAVAFLVAIYYSAELARMLPASWAAEPIRLVMAFVLLFVVTLIVTGITQWAISKLVESTGLSSTDRLLGFLFGSARGLLICIVVLMGLREVAGDALWWQASTIKDDLLAFEDEMRELLGQARSIVGEVELPKISPSDVRGSDSQ